MHAEPNVALRLQLSSLECDERRRRLADELECLGRVIQSVELLVLAQAAATHRHVRESLPGAVALFVEEFTRASEVMERLFHPTREERAASNQPRASVFVQEPEGRCALHGGGGQIHRVVVQAEPKEQLGLVQIDEGRAATVPQLGIPRTNLFEPIVRLLPAAGFHPQDGFVVERFTNEAGLPCHLRPLPNEAIGSASVGGSAQYGEHVGPIDLERRDLRPGVVAVRELLSSAFEQTECAWVPLKLGVKVGLGDQRARLAHDIAAARLTPTQSACLGERREGSAHEQECLDPGDFRVRGCVGVPEFPRLERGPSEPLLRRARLAERESTASHGMHCRRLQGCISRLCRCGQELPGVDERKLGVVVDCGPHGLAESRCTRKCITCGQRRTASFGQTQCTASTAAYWLLIIGCIHGQRGCLCIDSPGQKPPDERDRVMNALSIIALVLATCFAPSNVLDEPARVGVAAQGSIIDLTDVPPSLTQFNSQPGFEQVAVEAAHAWATGEGQNVAVLDGGYWPDSSVYDAYDFVDGDTDVTEARDGIDQDYDGIADDAFGHGQAVWSLIRAIAPDARFGLYRVMDAEGVTSTKTIALAVDTARRAGANVINISIACDFDDPILHSAITEAVERGVVVVAAAANISGQDLPYPARYSACISVSSSTQSDVPYASATQGQDVDVLAPGVGVVVEYADSPTGFAYATGTSFAAPFVTAAAALLLEQTPGISPSAVRERLVERADFIGSVTGATAVEGGLRVDLASGLMP